LVLMTEMKNNFSKKILNSVFTKLLAVLLITGLLINLSVAVFFMKTFEFSDSDKVPFKEYLNHYTASLIREMGNPPDLDRAREITRRIPVEIRYEGKDFNWSTTRDFPNTSRLLLHKKPGKEKIRILRHHKDFFIVVRHDPGYFIFKLKPMFGHGGLDEKYVPALLLFLTVILAGAYLVIRRILKPISALTGGVKQVSDGNLDYRVVCKKKDELGELAESFNEMTARIAEMLHTKERLLLDVSHELRSPITRMKVALEFLPEGKARENIREDILELEKMVSEILETARLKTEYGHLNLNNVDLAKLIKEIAGFFKDTPPGVHVEATPSSAGMPAEEGVASKVTLRIDEDRIRSVLRNTISNAVKYSENSKKPVNVCIEAKDDYTVIIIRDFGPGIPAEELPFIFEPFYRIDKSRSKHTGGYGLGLSLCKTIMEAHGGKIEIESKPQKGTKVSLFFPA